MRSVPLLAMLLSGLAGGFGHCISMCGPVVAAFTVGETRQGVLHHLLYNLGRITTYTILGALVGLSGSFLVLTASIEQLQRTIMIIAGLSIILMGLSTAEWLPRSSSTRSCTPRQLTHPKDHGPLQSPPLHRRLLPHGHRPRLSPLRPHLHRPPHRRPRRHGGTSPLCRNAPGCPDDDALRHRHRASADFCG